MGYAFAIGAGWCAGWSFALALALTHALRHNARAAALINAAGLLLMLGLLAVFIGLLSARADRRRRLAVLHIRAARTQLFSRAREVVWLDRVERRRLIVDAR